MAARPPNTNRPDSFRTELNRVHPGGLAQVFPYPGNWSTTLWHSFGRAGEYIVFMPPCSPRGAAFQDGGVLQTLDSWPHSSTIAKGNNLLVALL